MISLVYENFMRSPMLPEMLREAQRALAREQKLRRKIHAEMMPEHKWEFIQGEVIMHSPASNRHLLATKHLFKLLDAWSLTRQLGMVHVEKAMCVFPRNDYEPDVVFFGPAKSALLDADTLKFPIPDLIVEVVSPSTEARDRGVKFEDYAAHGVGEYWIVDPVAETVEIYRLADGRYPAVERQGDGLLSSDVVPGFEIPLRAIFDEAKNLAALKQILADAEGD